MSGGGVKDLGNRGGRRRRIQRAEPNPIDLHVGQRVRLRRTLLGLSQEKLGAAIGLTFQQIQKYERGVNRIGASRLWEIAEILQVPMHYFFGEMSPEMALEMQEIMPTDARDETNLDAPDPPPARETLELVRAYYRIKESSVRRRVYELIRSMNFGQRGQAASAEETSDHED